MITKLSIYGIILIIIEYIRTLTGRYRVSWVGSMRAVSKKELLGILEDHKLWVESGGKMGMQAVLDNTNLNLEDLTGVNLTEASLVGAELNGANLTGASLADTGIKGFRVGSRFGFAHFDKKYLSGSYVRIGIIGHSLNYWLQNYEEICKKGKYTDQEIEQCESELNLLKSFN